MGKRVILQTTKEQLDDFVKKPKKMVVAGNFKARPKDARYYEIHCNILDYDDILIPNWSFRLCVKQITNDDCQDTYGVYHQLNGNNESVFRLDVHRKEKVSHRESGEDFLGAHVHFLNEYGQLDVDSCVDEFKFDCMNCKNRKDWLLYFAKRLNLDLEFGLEDEEDLFGGWECSA